MSPSPGDAPPRTPDRKSSTSTIFRAFQTLTSGRPKSSPHANNLASALSHPVSSSYTAESKRDALGQRSFSENGSASTASQATSDDVAALPVQGTLGGPSELGKLLSQLDKARPLPERTTAAYKISAILVKYKINDPLAVWSVGEDLLHQASEDASRAGHTLLVSCARTNNLSGLERKVLFDSLEALIDSRHVELRLDALIALTDNGRNIDSIEQQVLGFVTGLLHKCYGAVENERKDKRCKDPTGSTEEQALNGTFKYITEVTKFNAKVFNEQDLDFLLDRVLAICKETTATDDITHSTEVIIALLTFTQVPPSAIKPCLEILADVYKQVEELKKQTWNALTIIFKSHLGQTAVSIYLDLIEQMSTTNHRMVARGAFRIIGHLFEKNCKHGLPEVPLTLLLPAIEQGLTSRDRFLAADVLSFARELVFEEDLRAILEREPDWERLILSIIQAAEVLRLKPFNGTIEEIPEPPAEPVADDQSIRSANTERSERTTKKKKKAPKEIVNLSLASFKLHEIVLGLTSAFGSLDLLHRDAVLSLLLRLGSKLHSVAAEVLIELCAEERLIWPSNLNYVETSKSLIANFLHDHERPTDLRAKTINVLKEAYSTVALVSEDIAGELAIYILQKMNQETDGIVLDALASFAVTVVDHASIALFETILSIFRVTIFQRRKSVSVIANLSPLGGFPVGLPAQTQPSLCRTAARHVIRMFISNVNCSAWKAEALYDLILKIAGSPDCAIDARICALKLLFRLRATSTFAIYIRPVSESERIAAVLCRTAETANWIHQLEESSARDNRNVLSGSAPNASAKHKPFDVRRPVPPLWFYPGPKGLPEEPPTESSIFVYSYQDSEVQPPREGTIVLKLAYWLETVITLLQQPDTDWEIYSYLVVHLGAQLANQNLFRGSIRQVQFLRNVLCEQLRAATFHEPPSYTSLKKADVAVCLFHVLTMLVGYHDHFARSEEDEIVRTFIGGIGSWERTSKWCIHALSVSCYELPLSVSKSLDSIISKMSQIITQAHIAIHILEFLVMLARLPELYKNFREDEYKMVFGVSFRYLQYVREKQEREIERQSMPIPSRPNKMQMRHSDSFRELRMLNDLDDRPKERSSLEDLPQYVYALAFHVITFWFMNLRLQDRPTYMPWISRNLTHESPEGKESISDQGLVTMDMMEKVAYSDRDETAYDTQFAKETDGEVAVRTWIIGYSLLTVETAGRTGLSQVTRRRPSGTKYSIFKPSLTSPPRHQVPLTTGLAADAFYTSSYIGVLPEDIIQEFYSSYNLFDTKAPRPVPLPEEESINRAISAFDRNSTVDGHKVGVIYIAEGQESEAEILSNTHGSADYTTFIGQLGFLTRLKGATFNTQGLDRSADSDGEYTYCWRDRATEIVFHITTMMPNHEHDAARIGKKQHIGNDFVNIIWNDSGTHFNFDTFPSQFNFVYIVVTPESAQSFTSLRDKDGASPSCFYKVQVLSAPGFPEISSAAETKVLSAKALADFVRLLALNASVFSLVWQNREGGEHFSPWRNRLREIKRLRDKYITNVDHTHNVVSNVPGYAGGLVPPTTLEKTYSEGAALISPPTGRERGGSALSNRISMATFSGSEDLSRSSLTMSSLGADGDGK